MTLQQQVQPQGQPQGQLQGQLQVQPQVQLQVHHLQRRTPLSCSPPVGNTQRCLQLSPKTVLICEKQMCTDNMCSEAKGWLGQGQGGSPSCNMMCNLFLRTAPQSIVDKRVSCLLGNASHCDYTLTRRQQNGKVDIGLQIGVSALRTAVSANKQVTCYLLGRNSRSLGSCLGRHLDLSRC